jgi:hypothetical protein
VCSIGSIAVSLAMYKFSRRITILKYIEIFNKVYFESTVISVKVILLYIGGSAWAGWTRDNGAYILYMMCFRSCVLYGDVGIS